MSFSKKDVYMEAAKIYVSPFDPTAAIALAIPAVSQTAPNHNTIVTYLEANYTFARAGYWRDVSITHDVSGQKKVLEVDDCDVGIFANITTLIPKLEGEWVTCDDLDTLGTFTGLAVLDVAATPVAVTNEAISTNAVIGQVYIVANRMGAGTIVGSIVVKTATVEITLDTDYTTKVDTDGSITGVAGTTYITFLTVQTGAVTIDYSYTPNVSQYLGYDIETSNIPFVIIKVVGCPDADGEYNTYYIVKASLDGEIKNTFVNLSKADDVVGSSVSFMWDRGGLFIEKKEKI